MPQICVSESGEHWFREWLVAYMASSHYLNQCRVIVNLTLRNKRQWNFNQNTNIFIDENASENIVCEIAAILCRERWSQRTSLPTWLVVATTSEIEFQPPEDGEGQERHGPNVLRMMSENVAYLPLTSKRAMHRESVFDIAWCCQPHQMELGQHPNLKWIWMMVACGLGI